MRAYTAISFRAIAEAVNARPGESVAAEVPPSVLVAIDEQQARIRRNDLLRNCDWTQLADNSLTGAQRAEWATYRQALRSLPERPGFPLGEWPTPPELPAGAAGSGSTQIP